jgi:ketohexokinase
VTLAAPILVVGNAVLDVILGVDHYPEEDEEMRAASRRTDLGGNAANTARVLAGLGHSVTLLATLAADAEAGAVCRLLAEAGVHVEHLVTATGGHTPLSTILLHEANGSRTIVHHRELAELRVADFRALPLQHYAWLHFEGRNVAEVGAMITHLTESGFAGRVSLEIEKSHPGIEALAERADVVLCSHAYAAARGYAAAPALLAAMRPLAPQALITCTWGEAGAWAQRPDGRLHHTPAFVPSRVVDTVGAGDVFNAGLIAALLSGSEVPQALALATRLAGQKVGRMGFEGLAADGKRD